MKNFLITGLALSLLMACGQAEQSTAGEAKAQNYSWSLVTTWPKNYPGLGMAPERFSKFCLLYTSPSPRDKRQSRMPSSA